MDVVVSFGDSGGWKEEELIRVEYWGCVAGSVVSLKGGMML